jgi:hypothetical protein
MGDIDDPHNPPDQREPHSNEGIDRTEHQSPDEDFSEVGHDDPNGIVE